MAKFVKKSKCEFINGYICKNNTILDIDPNVREYLNVLETKLQQVRYLNAQPEATPVPTMEGFERKSILDVTGPEFVPLTPIMNKKIEESLGYIREVNTSNELDKVNEMIGKYAHVLAWCNAEKIIVVETPVRPAVIDTPTLGDPLKLTEKDVVAAIYEIIRGHELGEAEWKDYTEEF